MKSIFFLSLDSQNLIETPEAVFKRKSRKENDLMVASGCIFNAVQSFTYDKCLLLFVEGSAAERAQKRYVFQSC